MHGGFFCEVSVLSAYQISQFFCTPKFCAYPAVCHNFISAALSLFQSHCLSVQISLP